MLLIFIVERIHVSFHNGLGSVSNKRSTVAICPVTHQYIVTGSRYTKGKWDK